MKNDTILEGRPPSEEEIYLKKKYWEIKSNAPDRYDDLAKSFLTIIGMLTAIYSAVVTYSKVLTQPLWFKSMAFLPVLLWLYAIIAALLALFPRKYRIFRDAPGSVKTFLEEAAEYKYKLIKRCGWLIFLGLLLSMAIMVFYVFSASGASSS